MQLEGQDVGGLLDTLRRLFSNRLWIRDPVLAVLWPLNKRLSPTA